MSKISFINWILSFIIISLIIISCKETPIPDNAGDSQAVQVNKHHSAILNVTQQAGATWTDTKSTATINGKPAIVTAQGTIVAYERTYYGQDGSLLYTKTTYDTIPYLAFSTDTLDTGRRKHNDETGDDEEIDTVVTHPKNLQFYVTVK